MWSRWDILLLTFFKACVSKSDICTVFPKIHCQPLHSFSSCVRDSDPVLIPQKAHLTAQCGCPGIAHLPTCIPNWDAVWWSISFSLVWRILYVHATAWSVQGFSRPLPFPPYICTWWWRRTWTYFCIIELWWMWRTLQQNLAGLHSRCIGGIRVLWADEAESQWSLWRRSGSSCQRYKSLPRLDCACPCHHGVCTPAEPTVDRESLAEARTNMSNRAHRHCVLTSVCIQEH